LPEEPAPVFAHVLSDADSLQTIPSGNAVFMRSDDQ